MATTACSDILATTELLRCDVALTEAGGTVTPTPRGPVLGVAVAEKGMAPTIVRCHGHAAHASTPRAGVNALVVAAEVVRRVAAARPPTRISEDWAAWVGATVDDPDAARPAPRRGDGCGTTSTPAARDAVHAHACTHTHVHADARVRRVEEQHRARRHRRRARRPRRAGRDDRRRRALHPPAARRPAGHGRRRAPHRARQLATSAPIWPALQRAVRRAHPDGRIAPTLFTGATDGRHLRPLGVPVFGFGVLSAALDPATYWSRFHGDDERIDIESLAPVDGGLGARRSRRVWLSRSGIPALPDRLRGQGSHA